MTNIDITIKTYTMQDSLKKVLSGDFDKKKSMMFAITAFITLLVWNLPIYMFGIDGLTVVQQCFGLCHMRQSKLLQL